MALRIGLVVRRNRARERATLSNRPIILVVPLGVGGSTDVIGRVMAEGMRQISWAVDHRREYDRRGRYHRRRPRGARGPGRYTILIGQWGTNVASGAIYPLQLRSREGLRADRLIARSPF